jgi:cysteinyl-tRNA synthetase
MAMSEDVDNNVNPTAIVSPFVDLLVALRKQLREEEQWALADEIRQQLLGLGIVLQDGPDQTTWRLD